MPLDMKHKLLWDLTLGAVAWSLAACATHPTPATEPMGESVAIARARADSARLPWTAADAAFMTHMIGHHAQAIVMSRMAPSHGADPSVQRLAARIINAQQDEIVTMQRWLRDRRQPVPDPLAASPSQPSAPSHAEHDMGASGSMGSMGGMNMSGTLMPGMLTTEQLAQLDAARGAQFDELFLRFMIQHHTGATEMVKELFATPGAGQDETVFKFASDVNVDQTTEIARMRQMLFVMQLQKK
jgi:uncharacterized protein (DUF305 family)